jgi:hypothetical protein
MNMNKAFFFLFLVMICGASCKKGELANERYFGKLQVESSALSTIDLDAVFMQEKIGTLKANVSSGIGKDYPANVTGKLSIYKSGQTALLADTLISIPKNSAKKFKYIYNESLGINGFLGDIAVPTDSVQIQFSYTDLSNLYPAVDICIWRVNGRVYVDDVKVIVSAQTGRFNNTVVTLPCKFIAGGASTTYSIRLKDPVTGNFISNGATLNWSLINTSSLCKTFSIAAVKINATGTVSVAASQL